MKSRTIAFGIVLLSSISLTFSQGVVITQSSIENVLEKKLQAVLLAQVNITDVSVAKSQKSNQYVARFTLETFDPVQRGVRYRIMILDKDSSLVFAHVFDDSLTLIKNIPVTLSKTFPTPVDLNGSYDVIINVVNKNGLPLATSMVEDVAFVSPLRAPFALSGCSLEKQVYDKNENVIVICGVSGKISLSSSVVYTLYRGNRAIGYSRGIALIDEKTARIEFTSPAKADAYTLHVQGYENGALVGKTYALRFAVRGSLSDIISLSVDKESYQKGETAHIVAGLRIFSQSTGAVYAEAKLLSKDQSYTCGPIVRSDIKNLGNISFAVPITNECKKFVAHVKLIDNRGVVLDEDMLFVDEGVTSRFVSLLNFFLIVASAIITLSAFVHRRHRARSRS